MAERPPSHALDRRQLLRGAGVLGGAAAIAAVSATVAAPSAQATPGNYLIVGDTNAASAVTGLEITAGPLPALAFTNTDGPQINLSAADTFTGDLTLGDIANTSQGPLIGVDYGDGVVNDVLVTADDLNTLIPTALPFPPERILDTRDSGGRAAIVRKQAGAINSAGYIVGGHWIDVALPGDTSSGYELVGAFYNLTVVTPIADGHAAVYTPSVGAVPASSTINYRKGITIANGGIGAVETFDTSFVVRIWVSATTHLVFDFTGVFIVETVADTAGVTPRSRVLTRAARSRTRSARAALAKR